MSERHSRVGDCEVGGRQQKGVGSGGRGCGSGFGGGGSSDGRRTGGTRKNSCEVGCAREKRVIGVGVAGEEAGGVGWRGYGQILTIPLPRSLKRKNGGDG